MQLGAGKLWVSMSPVAIHLVCMMLTSIDAATRLYKVVWRQVPVKLQGFTVLDMSRKGTGHVVESTQRCAGAGQDTVTHHT